MTHTPEPRLHRGISLPFCSSHHPCCCHAQCFFHLLPSPHPPFSPLSSHTRHAAYPPFAHAAHALIPQPVQLNQGFHLPPYLQPPGAADNQPEFAEKQLDFVDKQPAADKLIAGFDKPAG
ncbi:unnamed protein product [Closterium sp. NIES-54]